MTTDLQPGDELTLDLTAMTHGGAALGRHEGRVVFVRDGLPGETVTAEVTSLGPKGRYANARLIAVENPSPHRREHPWPAADALRTLDPVGGMDYGHIDPEEQRRLKARIVAEQLVRLGGFPADHPEVANLVVEPAPGAGTEGWRTRVHFAVDAQGRLGMHPHHSSEIVPVEDFPLATDAINALGLGRGEWRGISRIDVAAPADGSRPLVLFTAAEGCDPAELAEEIDLELDRVLPAGTEVSARVLPAPVPGRARGTRPAPVLLRGEDFLTETVPSPFHGREPLSFRVGPGGFWQIHRSAPSVLTSHVARVSGTGEGGTAWDLYGGAGLFAALLADQVGTGGIVWSVEGSPVTAQDARHNLATDGPARTEASRGARVLTARGDVEKLLAGRIPTGRPDVVVLDPPRQGAGRRVVELLDAADPRRIVYVACDPAALGRDAGWLRERGWDLVDAVGLDLYPDTHHVETVAVFERG